MKLLEGERIEDLQCNGLKIIQNSQLYTFTSDSVILANFIRTKKEDFCAEIGAGCGVISILVNAKNSLKKICAFELQTEMAELCKKNIQLNNLQEKIEIFAENAKNYQNFAKKGDFDIVFSNPPYFKETNFKQTEVKKIAKEEVCLTCEELSRLASEMLKEKGTFYCCYTAERACELIFNCQKNNLTVKEMFFTENGKGEVKLVVIKAVKGGKNGCKVFPNLKTNDADGNYLQVLQTRNFIKKY